MGKRIAKRREVIAKPGAKNDEQREALKIPKINRFTTNNGMTTRTGGIRISV
ncbi:MAG: hypothetical protein K5686_07205 [Lachnospiraceae bacterium]|nr:hypothetical protein [Lachnospiraceae bacterium]